MEVIKDIAFELDIEELFKTAHVAPGSNDAKEFSVLVDRVQEIGKPKAIYKESYIEAKGEETVIIDGVTFTSRVFRRNLDKIERVFPYVATCGKEVAEIKIDDLSGDEQEIIRQAVEQVYVVSRDDFNTREIAMVPENEREQFFDDLRKNYPRRWEFQNTRIAAKQGSVTDTLIEKLMGIGFKV